MDNSRLLGAREEEGRKEEGQEEALTFRAVNAVVKNAGHLNNMLPTGTFLCFQVLVPIASDSGNCSDRPAFLAMTAVLLAVCALFCILLPFTDTYTTPHGKPYHGLVTPHGLRLPPCKQPPPPAHLSRFRLRPLDFLHAFLSFSVFTVSALFTPSVTNCLLPNSTIPSQLQSSLPLVVGFVACVLGILFPSSRRGHDHQR